MMNPSRTTSEPSEDSEGLTDDPEASYDEEQLQAAASKAEANAHCEDLRATYGAVEKHKRETADQLPRWVKLALTQYETEDITLKEAARRHGRASSTLEKYASSPAGKEWRQRVADVADSPERLAEMTLKAQVANVTIDYLMAMQMALDAGDYKEFGVMGRDYLDRVGLTKKKDPESGAQQLVVIKLGAGVELEEPLGVESEYEQTGGLEGVDYSTVTD